jgi:hypothetical protein
MSVENSDALTQNITTVRLLTQDVMYTGSYRGWTLPLLFVYTGDETCIIKGKVTLMWVRVARSVLWLYYRLDNLGTGF